MIEATVTIRNASGMHVRACSAFVKVSSKFRSLVKLVRDDVEVDGKSIMGLLSLAAETGAVVTIRIEGEDEKEAHETLVALVEDGFGLDEE